MLSKAYFKLKLISYSNVTQANRHIIQLINRFIDDDDDDDYDNQSILDRILFVVQYNGYVDSAENRQ